MKKQKLLFLLLAILVCLAFSFSAFAEPETAEDPVAAPDAGAEVVAADGDTAVSSEDGETVYETYANDAEAPDKADDGAAAEDGAVLTTGVGEEEIVTVGADDAKSAEIVEENAEEVLAVGEEMDISAAPIADLGDPDAAQEYIDGYADNINDDPDFQANIKTALATKRQDVGGFATFWALLPPLIAILLALITKEVYSSLFIGILAGGIIYAIPGVGGFNFETMMNHVVSDGFIASLADSYNVGILLFLVVLGALVVMMNKAGGSAAFGRWAATHIKSRVGAQIATIILGMLIFIDDYFNCLTVGSVMRPVTDKQNVSRAKLSYLIDATAAPICIIAPISSWAAAVAGFAKGSSMNGFELFIRAIPFNLYAILTIVMMFVITGMKFDFGPMKKHEDNARNGDIFSNAKLKQLADEAVDNPKGRVVDLVLPVLVLIVACVFGMIYSGGFFTADADGYHNFITAFSDSDASVGLVLGSFAALIFTVVYMLCRRVLSFKSIMEAIPEGFKQMVPAIMILTCAWTLKAMTDSLGAKIFISDLVQASAGSLQYFLPAIIFLIAVGLSFATGTSWGTFGILIPIVLSVFSFDGDGTITIIAISACMAGAVCGDHCSPISDTTIMASAGGQCDHIVHVSTQLPYALFVAAVSFVGYIIAGLTRNVYITLAASVVILVAALICTRFLTKKNA